MLGILYSSAQGIYNSEQQHEAISTNLANAQTPGYKARQVVFSIPTEPSTISSPDSPEESSANRSSEHKVWLDFSKGDTIQTENRFDLALASDGFFTVETPSGNGYTRNGSLTIDESGRLQTRSGKPVLGQSGTITIDPAGEDLRVGRDGNVYQGNNNLGKLRITSFSDPQQLIDLGDGVFAARQGQASETLDSPDVMQGFQERSNVNTIRELVGLITIQRRLETNQRVMRTIDRALDRVINTQG